MERIWRELQWLWGTSWPLYAATVLGTNLLGAVGCMLFVRFLIPMLSLIHISEPTRPLF